MLKNFKEIMVRASIYAALTCVVDFLFKNPEVIAISLFWAIFWTAVWPLASRFVNNYMKIRNIKIPHGTAPTSPVDGDMWVSGKSYRRGGNIGKPTIEEE